MFFLHNVVSYGSLPVKDKLAGGLQMLISKTFEFIKTYVNELSVFSVQCLLNTDY